MNISLKISHDLILVGMLVTQRPSSEAVAAVKKGFRRLSIEGRDAIMIWKAGAYTRPPFSST
jgi:hypothetical protein